MEEVLEDLIIEDQESSRNFIPGEVVRLMNPERNGFSVVIFINDEYYEDGQYKEYYEDGQYREFCRILDTETGNITIVWKYRVVKA